MTAFLPWLIFPACLLMMMFMMRGIGGGKGRRDKQGEDTGAAALRPDRPDSDLAAHGPAGGPQARIAQLEGELAELRAVGIGRPGGSPAKRR